MRCGSCVWPAVCVACPTSASTPQDRYIYFPYESVHCRQWLSHQLHSLRVPRISREVQALCQRPALAETLFLFCTARWLLLCQPGRRDLSRQNIAGHLFFCHGNYRRYHSTPRAWQHAGTMTGQSCGAFSMLPLGCNSSPSPRIRNICGHCCL